MSRSVALYVQRNWSERWALSREDVHVWQHVDSYVHRLFVCLPLLLFFLFHCLCFCCLAIFFGYTCTCTPLLARAARLLSCRIRSNEQFVSALLTVPWMSPNKWEREREHRPSNSKIGWNCSLRVRHEFMPNEFVYLFLKLAISGVCICDCKERLKKGFFSSLLEQLERSK